MKKLVGDTAIYGVSSILGRLLNWLLVPLYVRVFTPDEYALVVELFPYIALFNIIYSFGFETTFFRFASKSKTDAETYFNLAFTALIINSVVFGFILILLSDSIATVLQYEGQGYLIRWCAFILAFDAVVAIPFARLRLLRKGKRFAFFKLVNIGINISLNLFFIVFLPGWMSQNPESFLSVVYFPQLGAGYVLLSQLFANAIYLLFFFKDFLTAKYHISLKQLQPFIKYAAPLVLLQLAGMVNEMFSRLALKYLLPEGFYSGLTNQDVLGIFGACYKLAIFMTLAVQSFKYAFEPFFFSNFDQTDAKELYANAMNGFIIFGGLCWIGITMLLPELSLLVFGVDSLYSQALSIVPILLGAGLLLGIFFNLSVWYKLTDRTSHGALISIIGAVSTIGLNILLIPVLGYMGSAWATLISWAAMTTISLFWGRRYYKVAYKWQGLFYLAYAAFATTLLVNLQLDISQRYFLGCGLMALFVLVVYLIEMRGKGNQFEYH